MSRRNFADGMEITFEDLNKISSSVEKEMFDRWLSKTWQGQKDAFFDTGFQVARVSATQISVAAGLGIQEDTSVTSPEPTMRGLVQASTTTYNLTAADGSNDRIDIVCVKHARVTATSGTRKYKAPTTGTITDESLAIETDWETEILIVAGTPAGSPTAPATPAGYIKIAEVAVTAVTGVAASGAITDNRAIMPVGSKLQINTSDYGALTVGSATTLDTLFSDIDTLFDGGLANANIASDAAIAGSKISPTFTSNVTIDRGATADSPAILFEQDGLTDGHQLIQVARTDGSMRFNTGNATRLIIESGGDVGIGTTSPDGKLHVYSSDASQTASASANTLVVENSDSGGMSILCGPDGTGRIAFGDIGDPVAGRIDYNFTANSLSFGTNGVSTYLTIDNAGAHTIGPSAGGSVVHMIKGIQTSIFTSSSAASQEALALSTACADGTSSDFWIKLYQGNTVSSGALGTLKGGIIWNGSAVALNTTSDRSLKKDIATLNNASALVNQLNPVSFKWKSNDAAATGFIAQEFEEVFPQFVTTSDDGIKSISDGGLIPFLTKAIQELSARLAALEEAE